MYSGSQKSVQTCQCHKRELGYPTIYSLQTVSAYSTVRVGTLNHGRLRDLNTRFLIAGNILSSTPRPHPERNIRLRNLAGLLSSRFIHSDEKEDLDECIVYLTEAILLPHPSPEDVQSSVLYFRYLRDHFKSIETFDIPRSEFATYLVVTLAHQVELGIGDAMRDIEEMTVLCRELLNSDISKDYPMEAIMPFSGAIITEFDKKNAKEPPQEVIEVLRLATMPQPDLDLVSFALARCLCTRFQMTFAIDDYEEVMPILDRIIASRSPGDSLNSMRDKAIWMIVSLVLARTTTNPNPEDLENPIYRLRALLSTPFLEDPYRSAITEILRSYEKKRFEYFGVTTSLAESHSGDPDAVTSLSSSQRPATFEWGIADFFMNLLTSIRNGEVSNIEEAVEYGRTLSSSSHSSDRYPSIPVYYFAEILRESFQGGNNTEYLDDAITTYRNVLGMPGIQRIRHLATLGLLGSLGKHIQLLGHKRHQQDLDEMMRLFPEIINDQSARVSVRFQFACTWAHNTRLAYQTAMTLMQDTLVFSPTLQIQHSRLVFMNKDVRTLPLDNASYHIQMGLLEEAIEILERGRALLWSEMRGLRVSVNHLWAVDPTLAEKFAAINQNLETVTMSVTASDAMVETNNCSAEATDGLDSFGPLVLQQRKLLEDRNELILQIQSLPGFQSFLKAPSFDALKSAASRGPVIIINHSQWRSDIVILHSNSAPSHLPTPDDFYDHASKLTDTLLSVRKDSGVDSDEYNSTLASVLKDLYQLVGKPIIERLRELSIPEQSRVWWCPTSVFCSLPLHAMGPVPSDDGDERYFSDLYICSYTPTLSALIESREPSSRALDRPRILLVAEFDVPDSGESLSEVCEDVEVIQALDTPVTGLISKDATPAAVLEALQSHRFVHFVCHGTLKTGEPFNAGFELHGKQRLTLLELVRSRLPAAEFAFLSACHTAEMTEESVADEGLHLVAAVQYCGFRSVVGTMWAMANADGRELTKYFYKSMLSGKQTGIPYYERSAKALRDAAKKLRRKREITLERWVNFVHYGA
ncbi:CHAT domain-containing protein [Lactarius akahatsu]|uniref:CHAT domain-containing protein n=1 Tax=Lactarius akahatsu TaxID=416441 RepID=A0AAD4QE27_9AGAM|nr:CHAT domain-containing protein [Lactarius akahatsu]